jgi:hypothetical protein
MTSRRQLTRARIAGLALFAGLNGSTLAAEYHCSGDGVAWTSSRPCPGSIRSEMRGLSGGQSGQPTANTDTSYTPSLAKAPDYLPYMSIECAQLNDALRTGPTRGLKSGPMAELRADYQKRCSDNEASARDQLREAEKQQLDRRQDQQAATQAEKSRAAMSNEQCYEMLRILHGKRQRAASMNDGEKADLQRFEDNYKARCPRR